MQKRWERVLLAIPSLQFIENKAKENGLIMINGYCGPATFQIDLYDAENSLDSFFSLVKNFGRNLFFYNEATYDKEILQGFCIDLEMISESNFGNVAQNIKKEVMKYNQRVMSLPTDQSACIELFIFDDGCLYSLEFNEDWHNSLEDPEEALQEICNSYINEINNHRNKKQEDRNRKLEDLGQKLIKDPNFKYCTTKNARLQLAIKYIDENNLDFYMTRPEIQGWVDLLWASNKNKF